ncbi:MAG: hypothetical protein JWM26_40 [Betaproteobacteria bacterium]|nr:hypothetical protein [Betaproteobacteria bacterium]
MSAQPRDWTRTLTLVLAAACVPALVRIILAVPVHVPLDPNEGWNAFHAAAAVAAGALYPAPESLYFNNYPPLSFYVVGAIGSFTNDYIVAGRALSIASFLWVVGCAGLSARALGASREHAAFAAVFLAAVLLRYSHYVGIDDPQLFGHAVAMTGTVALLRRPASLSAAVFAAALYACALFIKPNLLAAPIATLAWLLACHRRSAAVYAAAGAVAALVLLLGCIGAYGPAFISHLLSPRTYAASELASGSLKWFGKTAPFFVPLAWLAARWREDAAALWCLLYVGLAVALGTWFIGGAGVDQNVYFDAYIGLAVAAAIVLERVRASSARAALALACYVAPLAVSSVVGLHAAWLTPRYWLAPLDAHERAFAQAVAFVRERPGPAACEEQALCYWAGKRPTVDYVNLGQHVAAGRVDEKLLLSRIEAARFDVIQLSRVPPADSALARALAATCVEARRDAWGIYFVPRSGARVQSPR